MTTGERRGARGGLMFILVTVFVDVMSWGVSAPVFPLLMVKLAGGDAGQGAAVSGLVMALYALCQLFASPILGGLSDAHGRRPVLLIASAGLAIDLAVMAFAPNLWWLVLTRIIHAITASTHTTAAAYIADVTPHDERARAFAWMGAAFSFGFIIGPAMGGALGQIDLRLPFIAGSLLALANTFYGLFVLPESLPPERRTPLRWRAANPIGALLFLRQDARLLALSIVLSLTQLAMQIYPALWVLYTAHRYGWDAGAVGIALGAWGLCTVLVQTFLVGPVVRRWGEWNALLAGLSFWTVAFVVMGAAPTTSAFLLCFPLGALSAFVAPSLNALMSDRVRPEHQGRLQGANGAITSLAGLVAPLLYTGVFAWSVAHAPLAMSGTAFFIAAALVGAAALATIHVKLRLGGAQTL